MNNYKKFNFNLELIKIFILKEFIKIAILNVNINLDVDIREIRSSSSFETLIIRYLFNIFSIANINIIKKY